MLGRRQTNILVIKTGGLAAYVAAEPLFEAIRKANPKSKISLLTSAALQRISRASPYFDQVAAMPNFRDPDARKAFVKQLRAAKFEKIYDLAGDESGRKLRAAMGPFGPKWHTAALSQFKGGQIKSFRNMSSMDDPRFDKALADAGIEAPNRLPDFHWAIDARKDSANMQPSWYGISGAFGLLLPSTAPEKRWTAQGYAGLATIMARSGFMPVLAGPKELHNFADEVAYQAPQLVDLTGKTDHLQLASLAQEASFFVTDDAEEMHLALSVGCEGVILANAKNAGAPPDGRHVVMLTSQGDLGAVEPPFVWRTLTNMGLIFSEDDAPMAALAR